MEIETNTSFSAVMDQWFICLQKTFKNKFSSFLQSFAQPSMPHAPPTHSRWTSTCRCRSCTCWFFLLRQCWSSHLCNPFLHLRSILLLTPRFMYCHPISTGHHRFCRQIYMPCHPSYHPVVKNS